MQNFNVFFLFFGPDFQVGMNGDTCSIKAPKECSEKFAATFEGKFLTRANVPRIFFMFLEDFGAPLQKRCRHSSYSET